MPEQVRRLALHLVCFTVFPHLSGENEAGSEVFTFS